jgi:Methyltransferase domain
MADPRRVPQNGPPERYSFWWEVVEPINGWLHRPAAIHTMDMLECQELFGVTGSMLEIGVFAGKYFSILVRHACRAQQVVVGIDPFELVDSEGARNNIEPAVVGDGSNVKLYRGYSNEVDAAQLLALLGSYARFISIDGSHEKHDVYYDLGLAEQLVGPGGIVAIDDFLNYVTPGVNEAVFAFYSIPRRLVPFAFIKNKLFLTFRQWADRYKAMLEDKLMKDDVEEHSGFFRHRLGIDRALVEQRLWGSSLLLVP